MVVGPGALDIFLTRPASFFLPSVVFEPVALAGDGSDLGMVEEWVQDRRRRGSAVASPASGLGSG